MEIIFTIAAEKGLKFWKETNNEKILKRIKELSESVTETPTEGIGKPETLKYNLSGLWSRRINQQHRLIYEIGLDEIITIHSVKGHY